MHMVCALHRCVPVSLDITTPLSLFGGHGHYNWSRPSLTAGNPLLPGFHECPQPMDSLHHPGHHPALTFSLSLLHLLAPSQAGLNSSSLEARTLTTMDSNLHPLSFSATNGCPWDSLHPAIPDSSIDTYTDLVKSQGMD